MECCAAFRRVAPLPAQSVTRARRPARLAMRAYLTV
jgi:hypothetical protein